MKQATVGVHDHVEHAAFAAEVVDVNDVRVVVGVKENQFVVRSNVEDAVRRIDGTGSQVKVVRREGNQRVGGCERFNDHLRDLSIRRQVPTCSGIAVGIEATAVGAPCGEAVGFAQRSQATPVQEGSAEAVNDELRFLNRHTVLAAGSNFKRDVGKDGPWSEGEVPISGGSLAGFRHGANGVQRDPTGVVASLERPRDATGFCVGRNSRRGEQRAHGHEHHQDHHGQGAWTLAL